MSGRDQLSIGALEAIMAAQKLDDRALRILTDGHAHSPQATSWALARNPFMASFTAREMALGAAEVHRS